MNKRINRERKTIEAMIGIYCRANHEGVRMCPECTTLFDYAMKRLDHCPYGEDKPVCVHCPIHCYKKDMREQIRSVMRFAGPRMLARHPYLAIRHLIDEKFSKKAPARPAAESA